MTFINTATAALRTLWLAVIGIIPILFRDVGTLGATLGGPNKPDGRATATAVTRLAAAVIVVLLVYPALRNVYVMEFIDNPALVHANAVKVKAEGDAMVQPYQVLDLSTEPPLRPRNGLGALLDSFELHGAADGGSCDPNLPRLPKGTQSGLIPRQNDSGQRLAQPPCVTPD